MIVCVHNPNSNWIGHKGKQFLLVLSRRAEFGQVTFSTEPANNYLHVGSGQPFKLDNLPANQLAPASSLWIFFF